MDKEGEEQKYATKEKSYKKLLFWSISWKKWRLNIFEKNHDTYKFENT